MIDILSEDVLTLDEARRLMPGRGPGVAMSQATIYRHASEGVRGIRLETLACGGRLVTSRQALRRWVEAVTEARRAGRKAPTSEPPARTEGERQRASEAAARELDAMMGPAGRKRRKAGAGPVVRATA